MRFERTSVRGFTITEMMIALAITAVTTLAGWATWEMCNTQLQDARGTAEAHRTAHAVLRRIEVEVMRGSTLTLTNPGPSQGTTLQVGVKVGTSMVTRAFSVSGNALLVTNTTAGGVTTTIGTFPGVTGLSFAFDNDTHSPRWWPDGTRLIVSCTCVSNGINNSLINGMTAQMQTTVFRRN
jgi:prepilin-type N-terminal cleavage/methylation domain-containing protein